MKKPFMERVAAFIVDRRYLFVVLFVALCIFSIFTSNGVDVNEDLTDYLPDDSETRQGLQIMDREFLTYGDARVMVSNITYAKAEELAEMLRSVDGVKTVTLENDQDHYNAASALFEVVFDGEKLDNVSIQGVENVRNALRDYDTYIMTEVGNPTGEILEKEMQMVFVILVVIIILVLLLTSQTYAEVPILLITFGVSVWINKGTNYWFGEISFITNSIAAVLQLGLAIDYAIILCHHYTEERAHNTPRDAVVKALTVAIPEISASSLTTISGLLALAFMKIKIGSDMSLVLVKAILFSMLTVFLLMPALLLLMSPWLDKTHHRRFLPRIDGWGRFTIKSRYIVPPVFVVILIAACILANHCPYVFGYSTLDTLKQNEYKLSEKKINATFGEVNQVALIIPFEDYESEAKLVEDLKELNGIDHLVALADTEAKDGYMVTDSLTPRQFAELTDIDISVSRAAYTAYCTSNENFTQAIGQLVDLSNIDNCTVPLIDMIKFLYEQRDVYESRIDASLMDDLEEMYDDLIDGERQLHTKDYSRIILFLNLPVESEETYDYLTVIKGVIGKYYTESYFVGETAKDKDFSAAFSEDNMLISILTIVFVVAILLMTFKSVALPLLLILVIQGSIWINFSFPTILHSNLYFLAYLIVSAIMMGANIDYAIVISSRYLKLKETMPYKDAMIEALNLAFPTVVTSGSILAAAGISIGVLSSENTVASIGICLGRGTLLSMFLVMGVLPQILLLGDTIVEKTSFTIGHHVQTQNLSGAMRVNGHVRGYINGYVDAEIRGIVNGTVSASIDIGAVETEGQPAVTDTATPAPDVPGKEDSDEK
ncbi:MAG: MMPL family transporter [Oscillospiraceae bacterium]|nr:MMPL family transporter [Clostridiales bacterium]MDD6935470.1 MMPL family transporter [Clostridiales bacterium]MDY2961059.1 MMPL family transporter [Oscillospiraceae bacterium]